MALQCNCPPAAEIPDVPISNCVEEFGQIQKFILQRIYDDAGALNEMADPTILATWTPLLAASDGTKAVQTPTVAAPESTPGAARTYGGDNTTPGGITLITGAEESTLVFDILRSPQSTIKALREYQCEKFAIFPVDEFGRIGALSDGGATPAYRGIPAASFFIGDKMFGGLGNPDKNSGEMRFAPRAFEDFVITVPTDFNALTDLVTP